MATVYSLVCWGGKDGKTVTMTIASPCVVSLTNHGLRDGTGVVFSTTGALPTGVTAGTTYYSRSTATGTFNLYDTAAHAIAGGSTGIVNTSGSQSGTHTAKGAYYLGLSDKSRWTTDSVERIYGGIKSWRDARTTAVPWEYDTEFCEIGEAFTEVTTVAVNLDLPCAATVIESTVGGFPSAAFHDGDVGTGYVLKAAAPYITILYVTGTNVTLNGFTVWLNNHDITGIYLPTTAHMAVVKNCIAVGSATEYNQTGIFIYAGFSCRIYNNIVYNIIGGSNKAGIVLNQYAGNLTYVYNNLVTKCTVGMYMSPSYCTGGYIFNNISAGNTTNWSAQGAGLQKAAYNFGVSGDAPWYTGTNTSVTTLVVTAEVDFVDQPNNNFRPYNGSSKQVNAGMAVYLDDGLDIGGNVRPNYESATYPNNLWDAGPFEFDHGEGLAPSTVPISITGMVSGSEIAIYKASDMSAILAPQSTTGSYSGTYTYTGDTNIIVRVRKGTAATKYLPYEYAGTITSTGFQLVVSQIPDTIAQ